MNYVQLLNFLMRFRFVREAVMRTAVQPIQVKLALDQVARDLKQKKLIYIADAVGDKVFVIHAQLVPAKEILKGATLQWQIPKNVRNAKL